MKTSAGEAVQQDEELELELEDKVQLKEDLHRQLETLRAEAERLERSGADAAELSRKLLLQCDESQQQAARQMQHNKKIQELLQQLRGDMQDLKLNYGKQRTKFGKHLHQLMEQHKDLYSIFSPERVMASVRSAQRTNQQLAAAEEELSCRLHHWPEDAERRPADAGE